MSKYFVQGKVIRLYWIYYVIILSFPQISEASEVEVNIKERELRKQILSHYNKTVPPTFEDSPTDVGVVLVANRLVGLDELAATLIFEAYLLINWYDRRLSWKDDPTYNRTAWISISSDALWKPKMNVFNCGRGTQYGVTTVPAFCTSNGKIWWTIAAELHPVCVAEDLKWFPADVHTCTLSLGALYPQEFFSVVFESVEEGIFHGADRRIEIENPYWDLNTFENEQEYVPDSSGMYFSTDRFTFKITRRRLVLVITFLPLMICCMAISWSSLVLPAVGSAFPRRLALNTTALMLDSFFLSALVRAVPGVGTRSPIIVKIYACTVVLAFLSSLHTILLPSFLRKSSANSKMLEKLPASLQYLLGINKSTQTVANGLLGAEEEATTDGPEQFQRETNVVDDWEPVANVCDRAHMFLQIVLLGLVSTVLVVI